MAQYTLGSFYRGENVFDYGGGGGAGSTSALAFEQLTPSAYEELDPEEQNNGTVYFVSENATGIKGVKIINISASEYENLTPAQQNNDTPYFVYDDSNENEEENEEEE